VQQDFWPTGTKTDFTLNAGMDPLLPYKDDLNILKGITFAGTGDHKTGQPFSTSGFPSDNAGPSIDQVIGAGLGQTPLVLCGQSKNENRRGFVSFDQTGAWVTPTRSPKSAYESVFGPITTGPVDPGPAPSGRDAELEARILDAAIADIDAVKTRVPESELTKLDDHLDALVQLKGKLSTDPLIVACDQDGSAFTSDDADYARRVELHTDLIAATIACDARRLFSFMLAPAGHDATSWGFLGVNGGDIHNDIAHSSDHAGDAMDKMRIVGMWEAEQLARLVALLKATPEGDGTAFDSTVILWTTECTHGNHGHQNIPNVLIGSAGGALRTGQFFDGAGMSWENVLITLSHAMGHPISSFGASGSGPISDLLV
jgi:hypothetical protein